MGQTRDSRTHVAIVDDDKSVRRAMARLAAAHSFRVKSYASARDFLKSLKSDMPACLILDLQMPGVTGLQLMHHLAGSGLRIPTIVVTANDEWGMRHRCELAGAGAFLLKPVSGEALIGAIQSLMRDRETNPGPVTCRDRR